MKTNEVQGAEPQHHNEIDQLNTCLVELSKLYGAQQPEAERLLAEATNAAAHLNDRIVQLKADAYIDPLTGLPNRTAYDYDIACVWDRQLEHTIAYIDIDGLKVCNDHFGHPAGNRYIIKVANCLKLHCRPDERLYRIGGDEFVLISITDSVEMLNQRLEACRASLATSTFDDGQTPMSYSYGCAHANPQAGDVLHKMVTEADRRMYDYKLASAARKRMNKAFNERYHALDTFDDYFDAQDRIFQALSLTDTGRYLFLCNVDTDQSHWSQNAVQDFGLPSGNVYQMDKVWSQHIHPDDIDAWRQDIEAVMSGKKRRHSMSYRAKDASGRYVTVTCSGIRLDGNESEPTLFASSITNASIVESTDPATGVGDVRALIAAIEKRRDSPSPPIWWRLSSRTSTVSMPSMATKRATMFSWSSLGASCLSSPNRPSSSAHMACSLFLCLTASPTSIFPMLPKGRSKRSWPPSRCMISISSLSPIRPLRVIRP